MEVSHLCDCDYWLSSAVAEDIRRVAQPAGCALSSIAGRAEFSPSGD
jgi:hypothetical protein